MAQLSGSISFFSPSPPERAAGGGRGRGRGPALDSPLGGPHPAAAPLSSSVFIPPFGGDLCPARPASWTPCKGSVSNHQGGFPHLPWQPSPLPPAVRTLHKALDCSLPSRMGAGRRVKAAASGKDRPQHLRPPAPRAAEWEVTRPPSQS